MNGSSRLPEPVADINLKLREASEKVMPGKEISPAAHAPEPIDTDKKNNMTAITVAGVGKSSLVNIFHYHRMQGPGQKPCKPGMVPNSIVFDS